MWAIIPFELALFYGCWLLFLTFRFYLNSKRLSLSFATSLGVVLVASEYWELPIFAAGFLGVAYWWPYPSFAFLLNHILVFGAFLSLLITHKPKMRKLIPSLTLGIFINSLLILPWHNVSPIHGWIGRFVGITVLSCVFLYGSSLVGP